MLLLAFVLPTLLPWGEEVSIEAPGWTGTYGTGGRVWPAAESLCRHLLIEEPSMAGEEVLELGAGHGAVGIFAAKLGAERVEITDRSEEVLNLARRNAAGLANVRVRRYRWGEPVGFCPSLVLGSDITYDIESHEALCWTLGEVVLRGGRAIFAHQHRPLASALSGRGQLASFREVAGRRGLRVVERDDTASNPLAPVSILEIRR